MYTYVLEREQTIPLSRAETFAFFCDAYNLERITPPFLKFRVVTPAPISMDEGTLIEYELKLYGVPFRWRTLIECWQPEEKFVDTQLSGPYLLWHHTHTFKEVSPNVTLMRDRVLYRLPFGILGRIAHSLLVKRALQEIFDYRRQATAELLRPGGDVMPFVARSGALSGNLAAGAR